MPDKHFRLSPSSSSRWTQCPGSARGDLPEREQTFAMAEGTEAHSLAEWVLKGEQVEFTDLGLEKAVQEYVEFIDGLPSGERQVELLVESCVVPNFGGTIDCLIATDDAIYVTDFKFGKSPVTAVDNTQLMCYLCLAREVYPGRKKFFGSIVQPRVGPPQMQEYTSAELDTHLVAVMGAAGSPALCAGSHCRWCPLLGNCETEKKYREELVGITFAEDTPIEKHLAILGHLEVITELAKTAKHKLLTLALAGEKIPGYKLIRSFGNRTWTEPLKAGAALEGLGFASHQICDTKMKTPAQMEKVVSKEEVAKLSYRPDRGVTIAPSSSRAPEFNPSEMFNAENE